MRGVHGEFIRKLFKLQLAQHACDRSPYGDGAVDDDAVDDDDGDDDDDDDAAAAAAAAAADDEMMVLLLLLMVTMNGADGSPTSVSAASARCSALERPERR